MGDWADNERTTTATFGGPNGAPKDESEKSKSPDQSEILRSIRVFKRGTLVRSERQLTLLKNGDLTYSDSKQGLNLFFAKKDLQSHIIKADSIVHVSRGNSKSLIILTKAQLGKKTKEQKYVFQFSSQEQAGDWEQLLK